MYGKELKATREKYNYTQHEVARATGISQQNISRWEANKRTPSIDFCVILADFYGISLDELIDRDAYGGGVKLNATKGE